LIYDYRQSDDRTGGGSVFFVSDEVYSDDNSMGDSLEHHGVAGQKWGVKHGPPYPLVEGAKKVTYNVGKMTEKTKAAVQKKASAIRVSRAAKKASKAEAKQAKIDARNKKKTNVADAGPKKFTKSKQRISDMSSEELQARINRLKLEQEYKKYINGDPNVQKKVDNGKRTTDSIMYQVGKELAIGLARTAVSVHNEKRLDKVKQAISARNRHDELKRQIRKDNHDVELEMRKAEAKSYGAQVGAHKASFEKDRLTREHDLEEARRESRDYYAYRGTHDQRRRRRTGRTWYDKESS
jgi:hypothetical protein